MSEQLRESLQSIGFSDAEASVYLALLELGRATVSQVAAQAKINRTSGYHLLSGLVAKKLVTISGRRPKQEFVVESPERLQRFVDQELERQKGRAARTTQLVPLLKKMQRQGDRPQVRFYEGTAGLQSVYEDTLTSHESIRAFANVDDMHKALPGYFPQYYQRRSKKGIHIRAIIPASKIGRERADQDKQELRESALVPPAPFSFSPEINIYDNKVMIASWREKLGIIIESTEIADAMKKVYELAWAEAKRLDQHLQQE